MYLFKRLERSIAGLTKITSIEVVISNERADGFVRIVNPDHKPIYWNCDQDNGVFIPVTLAWVPYNWLECIDDEPESVCPQSIQDVL